MMRNSGFTRRMIAAAAAPTAAGLVLLAWPAQAAAGHGGPSSADFASSVRHTVPAQDNVVMTVRAKHARSWISVRDHSGRMMYDDVLEKGRSRTFTDSERIDIVLGDASAVELTVNGRAFTGNSQPGQVERLSFTPDD